jgi:hypothetical protein
LISASRRAVTRLSGCPVLPVFDGTRVELMDEPIVVRP